MVPQSSRQQRGNASEQRACQWLREQGLELVTQNWRCRLGEIDLIMQHGDTLVFVEVRYRAQDDFGGALASVDQRKQRRLVLAARHYLSRFPQRANQPCRFDVIAMSAGSDAPIWIENAFYGE